MACLAITLLGLAAAGCGRAEAPAGSAAPVKAVKTARIVVLAPGAAEMLGCLGVLDQVVARGDFVEWPPAVRKLPKVGSYNAPNEEMTLALGTDLLVTSQSEIAAPLWARLRERGIEVLDLDMRSFEAIFTSLRTLGRRLDRDAAAAAMEKEIRGRLGEVQRRAAGVPPRRVLFVVGQDPLYVAGGGSFLDQLITLAGGRNVAHDSRTPFQLVSLEAMLERKPEVILDTSANRLDARVEGLGAWGQWSFLPAVREKRVFHLDPQRLSIPGPRLPAMAEQMGRFLHPEVFGAPTPEELGPVSATTWEPALRSCVAPAP